MGFSLGFDLIHEDIDVVVLFLVSTEEGVQTVNTSVSSDHVL